LVKLDRNFLRKKKKTIIKAKIQKEERPKRQRGKRQQARAWKMRSGFEPTP
jgi:hypothetical protein